MLGFFRKYQKIVFTIVTFVVVVSFAFYGVVRSFTNRGEGVQDQPVGQLVDGSTLKEQRLYSLVRLLQYGPDEGGKYSNLLNDSIVHNDLILTGLGELLISHQFEEFKEDLEAKWRRAKHFAPYQHPYAPFINARAVWARFAPEMNTLLDQLNEAPETFTREELSLLFELYKAQAKCPPQMLHQVLYYQQEQYGEQIRKDLSLPQANVALFGFQSLEDWFGPKFLPEVAKFILNAACIAKDEGYTVSKQEAQHDLLTNVYRGLKRYGQGEGPKKEDVGQHFAQAIRYFGLNEKTAMDLWCEVMHFRRMFHEVGEAVFVDTLAFEQFKHSASPAHQVSRYSLPGELRFESFREMLQFQRYIEIVATSNYFELPKEFHPAQELMEEHPELVYKPFEVEVASVTKREVAARIPLKETWQWEIEADNFAELKKTFSSLSSKESSTMEERREAIESLDEKTRFRVDQYARSALVDAHPEWIAEKLQETPTQKQTLKVRLKEGGSPFSGAHFLALLEGEDPSLKQYTTDQETYYSVRVLDKGMGWHYLSFEEVKRDGTIDETLDLLLEEAYTSLGMEQPFEEVKDEVGAKIYADLLDTISQVAKVETLDDYAKYRFDRYLSHVRADLLGQPEALASYQQGPWPLVVHQENLMEDPFHLAKGEYSPVCRGQFYKLDDTVIQTTSSEEVAHAKEILKIEAEKKLMESILSKL
jgi:hypothetical protein